MATRRSTVTRRQALAAAGTLSFAGCLGEDADEDRQTWGEHEASDGVEESPHLGSPPAETETVILAFEDPSCSSCAAFAQNTLPELRERAVEPGVTSYVWRASPGVEPWGEPATRALVATYLEDPDAFWVLKERYYQERDSIDEEVVVDQTRDFLEDVDVNEAAVLEAMTDGRVDVDEHIERDEAAARGADVDVIPSFVLYREREYVTTVVGPQSYEVFEGALEL